MRAAMQSQGGGRNWLRRALWFFIAAGFNLSDLACTSPNNCLSAASKTVFRPWENLTLMPAYLDPAERQHPDPKFPDPVSCEPVVINLPFTPSNPLNR